MRGGRHRGWTGLALGLALMAATLILLHLASVRAGPLLEQSRARALESDAYFYTEAGDLREFLGKEGHYFHPLPATD
jgi:hypothetical protein